MEPLKKAEQIKRHFSLQVQELSEESQVKCARAHIGKLLEDMPMLSGDFNMGYEDEWCSYTSYWYAVLKCL